MRSSLAVPDGSSVMVNIPHFIQDYVAGAVVTLGLSRFQWSNPDEYGEIYEYTSTQ